MDKMKVKISKVETIPIESISYWTIPTGSVENAEFQLPIYSGEMEGLPNAFDACIVASDLQGVVIENEKELLLGEALAIHLQLTLNVYFESINHEKVLVLLCGDNYANLIKRGQSG
jgi:hypothetical protein